MLATRTGLSHARYWAMLPREFELHVRLYYERLGDERDSAWSRALMIYNQIGRAHAGKKYRALTLEDLKEKSRQQDDGPPPVEDYRAAQRRLRAIEAREAAAKTQAT